MSNATIEKKTTTHQADSNQAPNPSQLLNRSIIISALIIMSRLIGLFREMLIAFHLGASFLADIFTTFQHLIRLCTQLLDSINLRASLPFLVRAGKSVSTANSSVNTNTNQIIAFARGLVSIYLLIAILVALLFWFGRGYLIDFLAAGFSVTAKQTLAEHWWVICIAVPLLAYLTILEAFLGSLYKLWQSYIAQLWNNVIIVLVLLFWYDNGALSILLWALLAGFALACITSLLFSKRHGAWLLPAAKISPSEYKGFFKQCSPAVTTSVIEFMLLFIGINILGSIAEGAVAHVNYAMRLYYFPQVLIVYSLNKLVAAKFSDSWQRDKNPQQFAYILDWVLAIIFFTMVPAAIYINIFSEQIIQFIYERGEFGSQDTEKTALALSILAISLPFTAANTLIISSYFSRLMKLPAVLIVSIGLATSGLAWWLLVIQMELGIMGYCIGLISSYCFTFLIHMGFNYYLGHWRMNKQNFLLLIKTIIAGLVLIFTFNILDYWLHLYEVNVIGHMVISLIVGCVIYLAVHLLLGTRRANIWQI